MPTFSHCFNFEDHLIPIHKFLLDRRLSICTVHTLAPNFSIQIFLRSQKRGIISDAAWRDYEIIQWIELSGSICLLQFAHVRKDWSLTFFWFWLFWLNHDRLLISFDLISFFLAQQIHTEILRIKILHQNQGFADGFRISISGPINSAWIAKGLRRLSAYPWIEDTLKSALNQKSWER